MASADLTRVAAAAYPIETMADWPQLETKLSAWVQDACQQGAQVLVFPEYAGMEATLLGGVSHSDWCIAAAEVADRYGTLVQTLAQKNRVWIMGGSLPSPHANGLVNRGMLCGPDGQAFPVDKYQLTPWERANTPLMPGEGLTCVETSFGRLGAIICYDSEFPTLARTILPDLLLIPACTDTLAGQARVQIAARARALETQCATVHAPLLGAVPQCPMIDTNTGAAGIFVPPDHGLPQDGCLALGTLNTAGWVIADVPLGHIRSLRDTGHAQIRNDWPDQPTLRSNPRR